MTSYSHDAYAKLVETTVAKIKELSTVKGGEYAGDLDCLANFRRNAERLGLTMESIWAVYCNKHIDSINQYVSDLQAGKTRPRSESISGRADDVIVYMILFKAMVEEREAGATFLGSIGSTVSVPRTNPAVDEPAVLDEESQFLADSYDKYCRACHRVSAVTVSFLRWKELGQPAGPFQ
jgi:hypothetical protein